MRDTVKRLEETLSRRREEDMYMIACKLFVRAVGRFV